MSEASGRRTTAVDDRNEAANKLERRATTVAERVLAARHGVRAQFASFRRLPGAVVVDEPGAVGYFAVIWDAALYVGDEDERELGFDGGFKIVQLRYMGEKG